jgi:hypothetical protein
MARLADRSKTTYRGLETLARVESWAAESRPSLGRIEGKELKCGKGIPKFKCDFIFDYEPYGEVIAFRAAKCNHRQAKRAT